MKKLISIFVFGIFLVLILFSYKVYKVCNLDDEETLCQNVSKTLGKTLVSGIGKDNNTDVNFVEDTKKDTSKDRKKDTSEDTSEDTSRDIVGDSSEDIGGDAGEDIGETSDNSLKAQNLEEIIAATKDIYCINVISGNSIGEGSIWDVTYNGDNVNIYIITAGHVITDSTTKVYLSSKTVLKVTDCFIDEKLDLALLKVEALKKDLSNEKVIKASYYCSDLIKGDTNENDEIYAFDTDMENAYILKAGIILNSWIYVEDFDQYMIYAELDAHQGMSGAGIFDAQGCFVGLLCGLEENDEASLQETAEETDSDKFKTDGKVPHGVAVSAETVKAFCSKYI